VEDEETLETGAHVCNLADSVQDKVNDLLANGVMTTSIVVSGVFLSSDQLFRMEQRAVGTSSNLVDNGRFQIDEHSPRNVLSSTGFSEEGREAIVHFVDLLSAHGTIWTDTVLKAVQFPTGIAHLGSSLTNVHRDTFTHFGFGEFLKFKNLKNFEFF